MEFLFLLCFDNGWELFHTSVWAFLAICLKSICSNTFPDNCDRVHMERRSLNYILRYTRILSADGSQRRCKDRSPDSTRLRRYLKGNQVPFGYGPDLARFPDTGRKVWSNAARLHFLFQGFSLRIKTRPKFSQSLWGIAIADWQQSFLANELQKADWKHCCDWKRLTELPYFFHGTIRVMEDFGRCVVLMEGVSTKHRM